MSGKKISANDILSGVYGDFLEFGEDFDPLAWVRELKSIDANLSVDNVNRELRTYTYFLNALLIERIPDRKNREFVTRAAREVIALLILRVMCEYEGASRSLRVEASHEAVSRKGATSEAATWSVIDEYIVVHDGQRPLAKILDTLVETKRRELGLEPVKLSQHQIERHFASWRKAHPR